MEAWVWTLLVFMVCGKVNSQASTDLFVPCSSSSSDTGASNQPALPQLPNQFSVHIEANIVQKNHTENFQEYYDYNGNRAAILKHNRKTDMMSRSIIDLNKQTASYIMSNGTCISLDASHKGYFSYMMNSNGSHLKTVKDFLYFSEDKQEVFVGEDQIRGIPVNHWTVCAESPKYNTTFTVEYYFTKDSYLIDRQNTSVPVRLVVNGTGRSVMRNGTISPDFHDFYHIYEFSDFKWGPIEDESVFQVPVGIVCTNKTNTDGKPSPSIPTQFSAVVERMTQQEGLDSRLDGVELYVDMESNIYRMDVTQPLEDIDRRQYGNNPLTMVFDYSVGMMFVIDKYERNCTVLPLTNNSIDNRGPRSGPKQRPPSILAYFYQPYNFTYQGKKTLRDLKVDSWGYHNATTGEVLELLFRDSTYTHRGNNLGIHTEPVGVYHYQPATTSPSMAAVTSHEHVFNFMFGHPVEDAFDVVDCFSEGHHYSVFYMEITSSPPGQSLDLLQYHHGALWSAFRQMVSSKARVSLTRIFDIHMEPKDDEVKTIYGEFRLLDNILEGEDLSIYPGPSLKEAKHNLMMAVQDNIKFTVPLSSTENMELQITKDTLWEGNEKENYESQPSTIKRYSSASMAGLGIGMLVIGAILGLLAAFIIYKKIDTSVPYAVQN